MNQLLLPLFTLFAPLSLVTVGGGQAVVAEIQRQVVSVHHWMTQAEFVQAFAITRMAPGPGSLLATLIGWDVAGPWGAVVSTIGIFLPTAILIYGIANLWSRYQGARWQKALEGGLRPIAVGMILATVYVLLKALDGGWPARLLAFASTGVLMGTKVSPLAVIGAGAALLIALHLFGLVS